MPTPHIAIVHGPNLQQLGTREPLLYGTTTVAQLHDRLRSWAHHHGVTLSFHQGDDEAACVAALRHVVGQQGNVAILNPGGLTHTSVVLRDAVAALPIPVIEVHISNIAAREPFRAHSLIAPVAAGSIFGFGVVGYEIALEAARRLCP